MPRGRTDALIDWWADLITRRPMAVLVAGLAIVAASLWVTAARLTFQSDRNDLLARDIPWNQRFVAYQADFPGDDDLLVVVKVPSENDGPARARAFVRDLAGALAARPDRVRLVQWGYSDDDASPAAARVLPMPEFESTLAELADSKTLLVAPDVSRFIGGIAARLREGSRETDARRALDDVRGLDAVVGAVESALSGSDPAAALRALESRGDRGWHFLESDDGRLLFIKLRPELAVSELDAMAPTAALARETISALHGAHPGIEAGLSGVPVIEHDETTISMQDSTWCSVISIVGIVALMMLAHGGWRLTALALVSLLCGIAWSFGFLTVAIGHLQILSVAFTSILLGLGIDYAIYLGTRYEVERHAHPAGVDGFRATLRETLRTTGPAVVTGAVTPALAFGTTLFTDFKGMAEMGLIAGVGILLCLIAALTVFPAMLRLFLRDPDSVRLSHDRGVKVFDPRWSMPFARRPRATLLVGGLLVLACTPATLRLRYDYNLMNLQADGTPSVEWQKLIFEHSSQAIWSGASIAPDLAAARARTEAFRRLPTVASVGGAGLLFPPDEREKLAKLGELRARIGSGLERPTSRPAVPQAGQISLELRALALGITVSLGQVPKDEVDLTRALTALKERLQRTADVVSKLSPADASARVEALHGAYLDWRETVRARVAGALDSRPLTAADLPAVVRNDIVGKDGKLLVKVFPAGDVWEPSRMEAFLADTGPVDPEMTGPPVQVYLSALLIKNSYAWAGLYAFIAVLIALIFDFRRVGDALLALLPVGVAFLVTFGVMLAAGTDVNPANIIILPLLFGIGVESGVHMLHRDRLHPDEVPPGLTAGTGKGVVMATLTTIMGFGSMLLGHHRGIRSLGFVVSVGMTVILVVCIVVMPAVLEQRRRVRRRASGGESDRRGAS